jgi:hypothetical protein
MTTELMATDNPKTMIMQALDKGADPAVLRQLLDMQKEWEAMQAKKAYVAAMAAFKAECPPVLARDQKNHFGKNASIGGIMEVVNPILSKNGLSLSWETVQAPKSVTVTCHITHEKGHRESTPLTGPEDVSGGKNPIQTIGSTVTYLQRYTMVCALGLSTADQDDADQTPPRGAMKPTTAREPAKEHATPEGDTAVGMVEDVQEATVKINGKDATRYGIKVSGEIFGTLNKAHAGVAIDAKTQGKPVELAWLQNGKYRNVASISVFSPADGETEQR